MGNPHAIFWVDDVNAYDLAKIGPLLEHHPIFPERANITLAHVKSRAADRDPHLGARRRPDQGLRLCRRLRGRGRGGAAQAHRTQGDGSRCPAATSTSNGGSSDGHVLMTGPVSIRARRPFCAVVVRLARQGGP